MPTDMHQVCDALCEPNAPVDADWAEEMQPLLRLINIRNILRECAHEPHRLEHMQVVEGEIAREMESLDHPGSAPADAIQIFSDAQRMRHVRHATRGGAA